MTISKISIENIRGFESETLNVDLHPNCANIVVAPNGFGKSSLSTAFNCAKGMRLVVDEKDKFKRNELAIARLSIEFDGAVLTATSASNQISDTFDVHVIKSNIEPRAKLPKINGFTVAKPYLEIPSLDLGPVVAKEKIAFSLQKYRAMLGANAKLTPNLPVKCADERLRAELLAVLSSVDKMKQKKSRDFFSDVIAKAVSAVGTAEVISGTIEAACTAKLVELPHIETVMGVLREHGDGFSWIERVLICYILMDLATIDRPNLKKWLQHAEYSIRLRSLRSFIEDINGAWVSAEVKETKGRIVIQFPDASSLSNGQRDLLYFGCNLLRVRGADGSKPCILVIDEVFDYLDDANIVVAQYFISRLIQAYRADGRKIYVLLLTHLDPMFFKGYALKKQKIIYLGNSQQSVTETMRKVILHREDALWSADLAKYFLHYHPDNRDIEVVFNGHFGLPKRHGRSHDFYNFLRDEWIKCIGGVGSYDPFAVCAYVRVKIEQCAYGKISNQADRDKFLDQCNGTANKLDFAESLGIEVPESCLLLGVVYNDAMHKKVALDQSSSIAMKLRNLGLQSLMRQAIDW